MDLGLTGKVALVAGASRGLGKAVAETLAAEGALVSLGARDASVLESTARAIESRGAEVMFQPADVTRENEVKAWVAATRERFGPIDILVANGGGPPATHFETTTLDDLRAALELNLVSTALLCGEVVPEMKERRSGRIAAIMSISVKQPVEGLILSNTARAGVMGMLKTLANEVAPYGIGVNVVCPGYTRTDRLVDLARRMSQQEGTTEEAIAARWTAGIPMGRLGEPAEFASVVAFLCSERASYVTGTCLQVDGGAVKGLF